ncbi:MAG: Cof-type HAD-IIB family hydrolase [Polyangia bacterium]
MTRLICIDVDGTLVGSSGTVLPAVWAAAERARADGLRLALCSGRPGFGITRDYAQRLDPDGWHIFQNGASVLFLPTGRSLSTALPPALVTELIARARSSGRILEIYSDTEYATETTAAPARQHAALLGVPFAPRRLDTLPGAIVRAQWLLPSDEASTSRALPEVLQAAAADGLEATPSTSPIMPDTIFVNMTPGGVSKASAVRAVAAAYGIPLDEVMFVGDSHNDVGALRVVGFPVAMGNAEPAVREAARASVGHVDDGGLIEALELARGG